MDRATRWLPAIGVGLIGMMVLAAGAGKTGEERVTLDKLPAAVKATVLKETTGGKITEIDREQEHGVVSYKVEWIRDGVEREVTVTEDGAVLELEETVKIAQVPAAVRKVIAQRFGPGAKVEIEKKLVVLYEVEGKVNGRERELVILPTGRVQECEHGDHDHD